MIWIIPSFNWRHPFLCVHTSHQPYGYPRGTKTITCISFNHIQFVSLMSQHCVYQRWHSHPSRCCHCRPNSSKFTSLILHNSKICCLQCNSSQGKELSQPTPHWSIPPFNNWGIWLLTQTCQCVFTQSCQCHLELEKVKRPSSFYLGHFSLSKKFDHITKDANILHLKLGNNHRLNYFPTSTFSKHTSHHHDQSIASLRYLTYKYGWPTTSGRLWTWRDFHTHFELTWRLVTSPFSLILLLCTFS
jgi:hypothetical protein